MGLIRFLLAYCVVFGHAGPNLIFGEVLDPSLAVEAFYIISGFYIALVLSNSYANCSAFWTNRMLRILPVYYAVLLAALWLFYQWHGRAYWTELYGLPWRAQMFFTFSQLTLVFQDLILFTGFYHGHFGFIQQGQTSQLNPVSLLLIPQAWSLGVEVSFYFVAPFLAGRFRLIGFLFFASLLLRVQLARMGFSGDPWGYRFFPSELALFLLGMMAHRIYVLNPRLFGSQRSVGITLLTLTGCFIVFFAHLPLAPIVKRVTFLACVAGSLPHVFSLTKNSLIDRFIANLSYPIYVCHIAVMSFYGRYFNNFRTPWSQAGLYFMILIVAVILYLAVDHPVEKIRRRIKARAAQPARRPAFEPERA